MKTETKNKRGQSYPTNEEKIQGAMTQHPMNQIIIMAALDKYLARVAEQETKPENWGDLISWDLWKSQSAEIERIIN
tara:strand:+ start:558 stop:788 length:231 start_codon:yes stop_codon:yes gene_type:complete